MFYGTIIGTDTLATIHGITERVVALNNKIVENGVEDVSVQLEWRGVCSSVEIHLVHWDMDNLCVKSIEIYTYYYDFNMEEHTLDGLLKTLDEWEKRYGV
jgi:hypothetical protein